MYVKTSLEVVAAYKYCTVLNFVYSLPYRHLFTVRTFTVFYSYKSLAIVTHISVKVDAKIFERIHMLGDKSRVVR